MSRFSRYVCFSFPSLQTMAKKWVTKFTEVYHRNRVTPYMHAMMCHCGQFLRLHGSLLQFTQQELEKYNDRLTKMFFRWVSKYACVGLNNEYLYTVYVCVCTCRSTNMKGNDALVQIMQKHSRISILRNLGVARDVRSVTCRNCGGEGHYHLTCEKQCQYCSFLPYCKHLSQLEDEEGQQHRFPNCQLQE